MVIIPVGYGHVVHEFTGDGVPTGAAVTYGIDLGAVLDPSAVAADLATLYANSLMGISTVDVSLVRTIVKFGPDATGPSGESNIVDVGSQPGTAAPPNTAMLISKKTSLGGREGRGRFYLPGIAEGGIDEGGRITGTYVTAAQAEADSFLSGMSAQAGVTMVLLHNSVTSPTAVDSLEVSNIAATQRRRLRR